MIRLTPTEMIDLPVTTSPVGLQPAPCATIEFTDSPLLVMVAGQPRHLGRLGDRITVTGQLPFTTVQALKEPAHARVSYFTPTKGSL